MNSTENTTTVTVTEINSRRAVGPARYLVTGPAGTFKVTAAFRRFPAIVWHDSKHDNGQTYTVAEVASTEEGLAIATEAAGA